MEETFTSGFNSLYSFLSLKFSGVLGLVLILLVYAVTRTRVNKKSLSTKGDRIERFPIFSLIVCALENALGIAKLPVAELFMRFGNLFSIYHSSFPFIVVSNDYELIKQIMNSPDQWMDRPKNILLEIRAKGFQDRGILTSSGEVWKKTRRYTVKSMYQLGLGKKGNMEFMTSDELKKFYVNLEKTMEETDNKVPVRNLFSLPTINVIWRIIEGTEFSIDDPNFMEIVKATDHMVEVNFFEFLAADFMKSFVAKANHIFSDHVLFKAQTTMIKHFTNVISRRQLNVQENELNEEENFTDGFLRQMTSDTKISENMKHIFNMDNLMVTLFDLFEAGVDTTSSTLEFAMMYLATHPDVQKKMQKEIQSVIGEDELSYYSNKANMPYTQAVMYEVHRISSIVPLNFRSAVSDCYINNTFVKKGTAATLNLYSIHYDAKFWGDPYNFRPERFLSDDGSLDSSKFRRVLNFGAGKRVCLGESVANMTVFTFLTGIMQKYTVEIASANEELGLEINSSFTSRVKPFHAKFVSIKLN